MASPHSSVSPSPGHVRGARVALGLLLGINLLNYIDRYVLAAVVPAIQKDFFDPHSPNADFWMGTLGTAFLVSYMVMAPVFGFLADRVNRWLIVAISVILWSIATGMSGASGLFGGFVLLFITRLFVGVGEAGYGPAAPTLLSDYFSIDRRGIVLSMFYLAIPVGSAMGYMIGGAMGKHYGWHAAFYAVVGPGLILGAICLILKEPPRASGDSAAAVHKPLSFRDLSHYKVLFKTPSYVLNLAGMTAMTFAIGGVSFWMPKYLSEVRHAGDLEQVNFTFGAITAGTGFLATLAGGLVGDLVKKWTPSAYFLVSGIGILIASPLIVLMLHAPFPRAWYYLTAAEFFLFFNTGPTNTILANVTNPTVRATAFAACILVIHALGDAIAPPLLGKIGYYSWDAAFGLVAGAIALAGAFWLWGCKHLERDTAAAQHDATANASSPTGESAMR